MRCAPASVTFAPQIAADLAEEDAAIIATLREDLEAAAPGPSGSAALVPPPREPPPSVSAVGTRDGGAERPGPLSVYRWARRNRYFQLAGPDGLGMGGGGHFAFFLDGDLCVGERPSCGMMAFGRRELFPCVMQDQAGSVALSCRLASPPKASASLLSALKCGPFDDTLLLNSVSPFCSDYCRPQYRNQYCNK